jgi:pimeloyl-ACP methyl ester carboxylesterase
LTIASARGEGRSAGTAVTPGQFSLVALVPGLGLDGRSWERVRERLSVPNSVVLLPSLGQPAPRGGDLRVERQAERLVHRLPGDQRVILVGHSAGCPVAVAAAALSSDIVGLVLVGPVTDPAAQTWPRMVAQSARTATHEAPSELRVLLPQYRRTGLSSMRRGMDAMRRFRTDLALGRLTLPVEIVRGDQDRIASAEWASVLRRASDGRVTTVAGAAHMVPLTHPAAVSSAIQRVRSLAAHATRPLPTT